LAGKAECATPFLTAKLISGLSIMTYSLVQLAPGAYDLLLNGEMLGSVVRAGHRSTHTTWTAELLEDLPRTERPAPFKEIEHDFATLEDLCAWLGNPPVQSNSGRSSTAR
jgi:hypothetical protein